MSAKEMFEKLGYYKNTILDCDDKIEKIIYKYGSENVIFDVSIKDIEINIKYDGFEVLQAINKQVEELGWNNER